MNDEYNRDVNPFIPTRTLLTVSLVFTTIVIVAFDYIYSKEMMALSIELSIYLQKLNLEAVSIIFSFVVLIGAITVFILYFFYTPNKRTVFPMVFGFMICIWFHGFSKLLWMDSRPSFLSKSLKSEGLYCVAEFGKPSGHALFSFYVFLCLGKFLEQSYWRGNKIKNTITFVVCLLTATVIGFTRFYFGVHSFNQVILGAYFGWLIYFAIQIFKEPLKVYLHDPVFERAPKVEKRSTLITLAAIFGVLYIALLLVFLKTRIQVESDHSFEDSIINCTQVKTDFINQFTLIMELNSLYFSLLNFWFIGLLLSNLNVDAGLQFFYDKKIVLFALRTFVYLLPMGFVIILARFVVFGSPAVEIIIETLLLTATGFFTGAYGLWLLDKIGIPIKISHDSEELKEEKGLEMSEISA